MKDISLRKLPGEPDDQPTGEASHQQAMKVRQEKRREQRERAGTGRKDCTGSYERTFSDRLSEGFRMIGGDQVSATHTYAILEISPAAFEEIRSKLEAAGYQHAFHDSRSEGPVIDMHGIAVAAEGRKDGGE